jgi:hypothetical protein
VSTVESKLLQRALMETSQFSATQQIRLSSVLSRFGTRQLPTAKRFKDQLVCAARYEFIVKPSVALQAISSGIPASHALFWSELSVEPFQSTYLALTASHEPDVANKNQERLLGYLCQYIGDMKAIQVPLA